MSHHHHHEESHNHSSEKHFSKCNHCGHSLAYCACLKPENEIVTKVYTIKNLDCANCGAKIEDKLNNLPGIESCTLSYPLMQFRLTAASQSELIPELIDISQTIEPDIEFLNVDNKNVKEITYTIEGLDCANCALKVEEAISKLPIVEEVNLSYSTSLLKVKATPNEDLMPTIQKTIDSVEEGVTIKEKENHTKKKKVTYLNKELLSILIGGVIFALSWIFEGYFSETFELIFQLIAYIILGGEIVLKAFKNILKGNFFDENFLMSLATIAAFVIGDYHEGVGVMLFYRIGEYFEDIAVERSRNQIIEAVDLRPETVTLVVDNNTITKKAEEIKVNDIVLIKPGERVPLDGVILEGNARIDTSPITGEPVPITANVGDELISGTVNTDGLITMKVLKPLSESMVSRILESVENAAANKPKIDKFITKFSKIYTPIIVFLALAVAIIPSLVTGNWYHWVYTAITFLVISCPCALVLSIPLAYFCGIGAASKLGILFKGGISLEAIKGVKAIILDKTGTLTKGNFVVQEVLSNTLSKDNLLQLAAECELGSTHPIAKSIVSAAEEKHLSLAQPKNIKEIAGKGVIATINNETIYCGNKKLLEDNNISIPNIKNNNLTEVYLATKDKYLGTILIGDTLKENAFEDILTLKNNQLIPIMLTGDNKKNATYIANEIGIDEVYSQQLPDDKLNNMQNLRNKYGSVMYVGDGINDAPVLAGADVGAAMGSGSDSAIEAADVVFMTSDLNAINKAYDIGKLTSRIAWENVAIALGIKAIVLVLGLLGLANMWFAVFADTGVAMICILNSIRILLSVKRKEN